MKMRIHRSFMLEQSEFLSFWRWTLIVSDPSLISARLRKSPTYRVPWLTVTPGGDLKPRDLEASSALQNQRISNDHPAVGAWQDVDIITAWDALRFDTPLKWGVTAAASDLSRLCVMLPCICRPEAVIVGAIVLWCRSRLVCKALTLSRALYRILL